MMMLMMMLMMMMLLMIMMTMTTMMIPVKPGSTPLQHFKVWIPKGSIGAQRNPL